MMAVGPWAFRNGKSHESFGGRKGENVLDVDECKEGKECGGCYMSHHDWSLCRDIQVRKTDNGSSQQRGEGGISLQI